MFALRLGAWAEICSFFDGRADHAKASYDGDMNAVSEKRVTIVDKLRRMESCAVAFSGGVDSAVVAKAAYKALGDRAVAVTGVSASLAAGEREAAEQLARLIGIRHVLVNTDELASSDYTRN